MLGFSQQKVGSLIHERVEGGYDNWPHAAEKKQFGNLSSLTMEVVEDFLLFQDKFVQRHHEQFDAFL
jgi:hypothetical protein